MITGDAVPNLGATEVHGCVTGNINKRQDKLKQVKTSWEL